MLFPAELAPYSSVMAIPGCEIAIRSTSIPVYPLAPAKATV
jgi:hypothetical protein